MWLFVSWLVMPTNWVFGVEPPKSAKLATNAFLTLTLRDGSRLLGETGQQNLVLQSEAMGKLTIGLERIRSVKLDDGDRSHAIIALRNGDRIRGELRQTAVEMVTLAGKVAVPMRHVTMMEISRGQGDAMSSDGLLLHVDFEKAGRGRMGDAGPSQMTGISENVIVHEERGRSVGSFNGSAFVKFPDAEPVAKLRDAATVSVWVYIPPGTTFTVPSDFRTIISKGATYSSRYADFAFGLSNPDGAVVFEQSNASNRPRYVTGATTVPTGRWSHLAAVLQEGRVTLYLNGQIDGQENSALREIRASDQPLYVGCRYPEPLTGGFLGNMDDLLLWNRALTSTDIASLYRGGGSHD